MNEDEAPTSAAEMRALAEEAEAEAAEAEALAAAARARARAIQLRRKAELAESEAAATAAETSAIPAPATEKAAAIPAPEVVAAEEDEAASTSGAASDEDDEAGDTAETEALPDQAVPEETEEQPLGLGRLRRLPGIRSRPKWSTIAAAVATLIIIAALSGSAYMIYMHHKAERERQRVAEFAKAASQEIINLTSLDFNDAKTGVQRVLDNATGQFKDEFTKTADQYVKTVEEIKVHSQGTVEATAVDRDTMTDDSAVVLVASTQEVTNAAGAKQEPRSYRFIVTVTRDGGQLKVSKLEFVP